MLGRIAHLGIDHEQEAEDGNRNGRKDQALQGTLEDEPGPDENAADVVRPPEEVRQDTPSCAEVRHAHNHAVVAAGTGAAGTDTVRHTRSRSIHTAACLAVLLFSPGLKET